MIFGDNHTQKSTTRSATARLDRGFTGDQNGDALERAAAQFRAAIIFRIPEGYQDEAGFHYGAQSLQNELPADGGCYPQTPF
jgi:hypothetical protein